MPAKQVLVAVGIILSIGISNAYSDQEGQLTSFLVSNAGKEQEKGSAVVKIIQLLGEMKAKTQADIEEERQGMEEYMQYCSDGSKEKEFSLKTSARAIQDNTAIISESEATITELDDEVEELGTAISELETELQKATAIREAEKKDFQVVEKDLMTTVKQLSMAIEAIKKGKASFIQGKGRKMRKNLAELASVLSNVVESVKLTGEQKRGIKTFLLQSSDSEEDDLSLRKSLSGQKMHKGTDSILEVLADTKDKSEKELTEARKAEMEANHKYEMLRQSLENELATKKKRTADAQSEKAATQDAKGEAEGELAEASKMKEDDEEFLKTLRADCQEKAIEWEHRLQEAKGEIAALTKATEILQKGASSAFIQVSVRRVVRSHRSDMDEDSFSDDEDGDYEDENLRRKVVQRLRVLQRSHRSNALAQLMSHVKADPFVKIRGLIEEMIAKLMEEAQQEASQKAFCDEEMGKSKKAMELKSGKIDKYKARLDEAISAKTKAQEEIKELQEAMAAIDAEMKEATDIRNKEHEEFLKAQSDFKSAADACTDAIAVLKEYYQGSSLLQVRVSSETSGDNSAAGATIISFLETAQADYSQLLAEVEAAEDKAVKDFETLSSENKVSKAQKTAEAKGKNSQVKILTQQIEDLKVDTDSTQKELDAVTMYIEKLKPECETKAMSASEKIAAREAEIEGLKEALSTLEGAGGGALIQSFQTHRHPRLGYLRGGDLDGI